MNPTRLLILFGIIALSACTSGKKAYERGDYYEAVMQAVNRLRQNPDHDKSKEALKMPIPWPLTTFKRMPIIKLRPTLQRNGGTPLPPTTESIRCMSPYGSPLLQ
ncbi:MAG: hypothetical protein WAZ98_14685 [Cyclobacteriaceae bacterium]